MDYKYYCGIDPGKEGGVTIINNENEIVWKDKTPKIGTEYDKAEMRKLLTDFPISHAVLEDVHAIFGSSAKNTFEFGRGKGIWEGMLMSLEIPHTLVQPKEWQKEVWSNSDKVTLPTKKISKKTGKPVEKIDTKATSTLAAKRLFPRENLAATERSKTAHSGIVDSILMAVYCRRKFS